jgi:hypothetical protein
MWLARRHAERCGLSLETARQHIAAVAISARPKVEIDDLDAEAEEEVDEPNKSMKVGIPAKTMPKKPPAPSVRRRVKAKRRRA